MNQIARFALAGLAVASLLAAAKKPVTLETLAAPPAPRSGFGATDWAPDGHRFAYTEERELWIYDAAKKHKRKVVEMSKLDELAHKTDEPRVFDWTNRRVSEQPLQWFAKGDRMLVISGGDLFVLHLDHGAIEQLTNTSEPERDAKLSPDNTKVSFRRGHDLYVMDLVTKKETRLTHDGTATLLNAELDWVYPEELDLGTAHWWSPDSRSIAYLQLDISREPVFPQVDLLHTRGQLEPERYPKAGDPNAEARVGVVGVSGGDTRWMNFGETRDFLIARVAWLPDSSAVAAIRLNRVQDKLDLLAGDARTGSARVLLHEEDKYWLNVDDTFRFLDNDRFLWASERSGHRHLYLYRSNGELEKQITSGDWDLEGVAAVDAASQRIFYNSTEASPLERQLYSVRFDGGGKQRVTAAKGTHGVSVSPTGAYFIDTFSNLTTPPSRVLYQGTGEQVAVLKEADRSIADEYEILPTEIQTFHIAGGAMLYARLIKPAGFRAGVKYPVIVDIYGGPHAQTVTDRWSGPSLDQVLAQKGFVIWQVDNRGSYGRGHLFEVPVYRNLGAVELADQKAGLDYLKTLGFADMSRVGISGWSYGGYMTLYCLTNAPGYFAAGVAGAPVTSWRNYDSIYTERYMGLPSENARNYDDSSPQKHAAELKAKLLILHNLEDDNVHFQNTMQMAEALERANRQFRMVIYPQKSHGVGGPLRKNLNETYVDFFEEALHPGQ